MGCPLWDFRARKYRYICKISPENITDNTFGVYALVIHDVYDLAGKPYTKERLHQSEHEDFIRFTLYIIIR